MITQPINMSMYELIEMATKIGTEAGIKEFENQKKKFKELRSERRLRNTKLLLENYRSFKLFCNNAVCQAEVKIKENAIDILDSLEDVDSETLFIESIKKSVARTVIMVQHIVSIMDIFQTVCSKKKKEKQYQVLYYMYIHDDHYCNEKIAELIEREERQIYNISKTSIESLSPIMFGIDALKLS